MEKALFEASLQGDTRRLNTLLSQNPVLLLPFLIPMPQDTPLHVASQAGHVEFVTDIWHRGPKMARVPNNQGMFPIHLAAASGSAEVVMLLVALDGHLPYLADRDGRAPIHVAAACNQVEVLKRLIDYNPRLVDLKSKADGETILHLSARYGQLDAVKFLTERFQNLVHVKDFAGNSALQSAKAAKQRVIVNYLLETDRRNYTDQPLIREKMNQKEKEEQKAWFKEKQDTILIVATVIAGATFQVGVEHSRELSSFRFCITVSFGLSILLFVLLASGGRLNHWVQARISLIILWASLFFMSLSYGIYILYKSEQRLSKVAVGFMILITTTMFFALVGHIWVLVFEMKHNVQEYREGWRNINRRDNERLIGMGAAETPTAPLASGR